MTNSNGVVLGDPSYVRSTSPPHDDTRSGALWTFENWHPWRRFRVPWWYSFGREGSRTLAPVAIMSRRLEECWLQLTHLTLRADLCTQSRLASELATAQ